MAIKRTAKYLAAVTVARELGLMVAVRHSSAEQLYTELENTHYWDSSSGNWLERQATDPLREMDKSLVRVRVTAHMDKLNLVCQQVTALLEPKFVISEVSKPYPNVRDSDGAGRIYITLRSAE